MSAPPLSAERLDRVFAAFERAARTGSESPTNLDLAIMLGLTSPGSIPNYVQALEAAGRIRVERFHRARRVTIVATGQATHVSPQRQIAGRFSGPAVRSVAARDAAHARERAALEAVKRFANPARQCPFKPFLEAEADAFADALEANGGDIEAAALAAGRSLLDGYRHWHAICAEMGEAPRLELAKASPASAASGDLAHG
mgnify:CR=1 FL=1